MNERTNHAPARSSRRLPGGDLPVHATWRELVRVAALVRQVSEPHMARMGVSGAQWGVLRSLSRLEDQGVRAPRMHELAAELVVHPPSLSATLDRMVRAGLVTRAVDASDRRSRIITLTPAGRRLLRDALRTHWSWVEYLVGDLSKAELRSLDGLLRKLSVRLKDAVHGPVSRPRPNHAPRSRR